METVISSLISIIPAIIAALVAIKVINKQLRDNLDSKSGWRKNLFKLASKKDISLDDIYLLRATLRIKSKRILKVHKRASGSRTYKINLSDINDFSEMTALMIYFCEKVIAHSQNTSSVLTNKNQEITRIFARYLLKHHWEINHDKNYYEGAIIRETIEMINGLLNNNDYSVFFMEENDNRKLKEQNVKIF